LAVHRHSDTGQCGSPTRAEGQCIGLGYAAPGSYLTNSLTCRHGSMNEEWAFTDQPKIMQTAN